MCMKLGVRSVDDLGQCYRQTKYNLSKRGRFSVYEIAHPEKKRTDGVEKQNVKVFVGCPGLSPTYECQGKRSANARGDEDARPVS